MAQLEKWLLPSVVRIQSLVKICIEHLGTVKCILKANIMKRDRDSNSWPLIITRSGIHQNEPDQKYGLLS